MTDEDLKRLAPLEYYKWHWMRFRANRRVIRMDYIARGHYRELLDEQWGEGSLPANLAQLADICGCPLEVMQDKWPQIEGCFLEDEHGRLFNQTLEDQRTELDTKRVKYANSGRSGGRQKLANARQSLATASDGKQSLSNRHIEEKRREELEEKSKTCVEASSTPPAPRPKLAGTLPLIDKTDYEITVEQLEDWKSFYPALDVKQQLMSMKSWLIANPRNQKTRSGIVRFIDNWLRKEQNRAPRVEAAANGGKATNGTGGNGNGVKDRADRSRDAIRQAAEKYGLGSSSALDGADEGELSGPGASAGDGGYVDGRVAGDGEGLRA